MSKNCAVILAAGEGKRMTANKQKPMMEGLDRPMIDWVLDATEASGVNDTILVVGAYGEQLVDHCGDRSAICWQKERLGTGHAVMMALDYLNASDAENVLILNGDAPFMDAATISAIYWPIAGALVRPGDSIPAASKKPGALSSRMKSP